MNLACNPTKAGLAFSILTQFSEKSYSFNSKEELKESNLPDYYAIGTTTADKLMFGLLYWVFNIVAQSAVSARPFLEEIGLPKQLLSVIRELTQLKLSKSIPTDYAAAEKMFSEWLAKTFEDTLIDSDENNGKFNLFSVLSECFNEAISQSGVVVLNECIFRGFYTLRQLYIQIREKKITSISDFYQIDMRQILPVNNRVVSRMSLIASGTFAGVNITGAVLKAIAEEKKDGRGFAEVLRAEINVAGIGRFIFAVAADSKYWAEDIKIAFSKTAKGTEEAPPIDADAFDCLTLNPVQARILYSMEAIAIHYDIAHTDNPEDAKLKQTWMEEWKNRIVSGFGYEEGYFVEDEEYMYDGFFALSKQPEHRNWFYLMTMELALFKPYHDLGPELDSKYKKLKRSANYIDDCFARKQTIVSQGEIDAIRDAYKKYKGVIDGSRDGNIIKGVAVVVDAAAAGGMAFVFAPGIAVALAGEAVVGLHGAALTSASLAFVGGGSLVAGGLGMAGGTAIITGGGALVGLLGTETASIATVLAQTPVEYWIRQSAKLLTYSGSVLIDCFHDKDSVIEMLDTITGVISYMEQKQKELEEENITLDKVTIKSMKEYIKHLKRCESELKKLTK